MNLIKKTESTNAHKRVSESRQRLVSSLPVTDRRLVVCGLETGVLEGGEGPPIVLLHGQGEFAATWLRVIPQLAKRYHVIAADLPGHGASESGDLPLDVEQMNAWLGSLIEQTCPHPPVVVGHLLGGAIAARFAATHGDRLRQLVLVDSLGLAPYRPSARFALAMVGFLARPNERTQKRLFSRCMLDLDDVRRQTGSDWEPLLAYALEGARSAELKSALKSLMPKLGMHPIPPDELERISVPTGLIWGRHDLQVRVQVAERARDRYGWPLRIIDRSADDPAVEQPEEFLRALDALTENAPRHVSDARLPELAI